MRIGILFSGGKDSTNTLWYYHEQAWDVACLLSLLPQDPDSYMFQTTAREILEAQAAALQLPLVVQHTKGEEELELEDLRALLLHAKQTFGIEGVAVGALASDYQHERVTRICHEIGLKTYAPLWHKSQERLLRELIKAGFDVRMVRIAADGLDVSWLGRRLELSDVDRLEELSQRIGLHVGGEGGEYETLVLNGPIFAEPVVLTGSAHMESEHRGEWR